MKKTNYEWYIDNLTQEKFIDSMILNCDGCPAYPCGESGTADDGITCYEKLSEWCETERQLLKNMLYAEDLFEKIDNALRSLRTAGESSTFADV